MIKTAALTLAACMVCTGVNASTLSPLDLTLRVDTVGITNVIVEDANGDVTDQFEFVKLEGNVLGVEQDIGPFRYGDTVRLSAQVDPATGLATTCDLGGLSCVAEGQPGTVEDDRFNFSDGSGRTPFDDFSFEGGTGLGDTATLASFGGGRTSMSLLDDEDRFLGRVSWDQKVKTFTVTQTSLAVVPLTSSALFLGIALGGLGLLRRRNALTT